MLFEKDTAITSLIFEAIYTVYVYDFLWKFEYIKYT